MDGSLALHYERLAQERRKRNASPYARPVFDRTLALTAEALLDCAESLGIGVIPNGDTIDFVVRFVAQGQDQIAGEILARKKEILQLLAPESRVVVLDDELESPGDTSSTTSPRSH